MSTFVIACGGTGGHLTPGIAIAQELAQRRHRCILVTSQKEVDKRLLLKYPHLIFVTAPGVAFSLKPLRFLRFLWQLVQSVRFFSKLIAQENPSVVMGFGGFLSAGAIIAGCHKKICVLHEANRKPGRVTRCLSRFTQRLYLPEGVYFKNSSTNEVRHYGYPLRAEIQLLAKEDARASLGFQPSGRLLLVIGGSQGAQALNRWALLHRDDFIQEGINVLCVTGLKESHLARTESHKSPQGKSVTIRFIPFLDAVSEALSACDLVVARAGAGSIAEFVALAVPSILIPYPHAADDHQKENVSYLARKGASFYLPQRELESHLFEEVSRLISDEARLAALRQNLKNLQRINSTGMIANDLEALCTRGCQKDSSNR